MPNLIEPSTNLLYGIIESTRLNQTPAELRNRVTQLEERNAAMEMASWHDKWIDKMAWNLSDRNSTEGIIKKYFRDL